MTPIEVQNLRKQLWQNGFRPIAVYSHDAVTWSGQPVAKRGKRPKGEEWGELARQNPPIASLELPPSDALNTGILCDGLIAVDIDVNDPAIVLQIVSAARQHLGSAPCRTRADSSRCLLLYRAAEGEPKTRSIDGQHGKVEVLGHGKQLVAFGTHPDGAAYEWPQGGPDGFHRDTLTAVSQDALHAFLCAVAPLIGAEMPSTPSAPSVASPGLPIQLAERPEATEREKQYAENALADEAAQLSAMIEGEGRNAALNTSAHSQGTMVAAGWIEQGIVEQRLWAALEANGYRAKDGDSEAWKTLQSGLQAGMEKPRPPLASEVIPQWLCDSVAGWIEAYKAKHSSATSGKASGKQPVALRSFSSIQERPIQWLWKGYLPLGKLTLLAGVGGVGKSTVAFNWTGAITTAGFWPDGSRCNAAGNVLIWSSEDDPNDTIKPRLLATGADVQRCYFIQGPKDEQGVGRSFDPANDMDGLRKAASSIGGVSLLIVDPIVTAVTGDMNKANDVRRALQTFVDFAAEYKCAILGITHFTKGSAGKNSAERILGSGAFKDFSRTALVAGQDEETGECALVRAKTNIAANTGGFSYTIDVVQLHSDIETTRILWGEPLKGSARSILARFEGDGKEDGEKMKIAKQFLIGMLNNGPQVGTELIKYARERDGITEGTLRRAADLLGVGHPRDGFQGLVMWALPLVNQSRG